MTVLLAVALVGLLALRVLAAAAETMLARDAGGRAEAFLDDDILASTARAAAQMAGAAVVGVIATLVWMRPGRGSIPLALVVGVPAMLIVCDLVPRGLVAASRTWPRPSSSTSSAAWI